MTVMRSRRALLSLGVSFLSSATLNVASARSGDVKPGPSLAGQLLVAAPEMSDPRFSKAVILMVQHDSKGALGIAINRPADEWPIVRLLDALGIDSKGSTGTVRLFAGGPVQPRLCFIVHSAEYRRPGTVNIDGRVAMTSNPEVLRDIGRREGPRESLVALGYAGWGPGQLDSELALGGWFTVPEEPNLVFEVDRSNLWDEAMKRHTISL